jgi:hypothetical protein
MLESLVLAERFTLVCGYHDLLGVHVIQEQLYVAEIVSQFVKERLPDRILRPFRRALRTIYGGCAWR